MTTVKVTLETREKIREYAGDESVDKALNRLFDESDKPDEASSMKYTNKTNIRLSEDTFERLKEYKLSENESHSDTILRLLLQVL